MVTLLVVSLLLLVVLSFSVFVRMELRQVANRQDLLVARSNARLGANIAIAALQFQAGPDTRVTAPISDPAGTAAPNQLLFGQVVDAAPYVPDGAGGLTFNSTYAQILGYLVSQDPGVTFDPSTYFPFDSMGDPTDGNALLVGPGSTSTLQDDNGDGVPDGFVAAPYVDIPASNGAFSWWVSDEGMKAQINIVDTVDDVPNTVLDADAKDRARVVTTQRSGSEALMANYDPGIALHDAILERALNPEHINLVELPDGSVLDPENAVASFHDVTLQSLGLPTNTKRGGLKRDLTAVIRETEDNAGVIPTFDDSGASDTWNNWTQLLSFQEDRVGTWRDETVALSAVGAKPLWMKDRHWNGLQAFTLRADQANDGFRDRVFPPMTDMHWQWDLGGATWRQVVSWATYRERIGLGASAYPKRRWQENMAVAPVIANVSLSYYATVDWPEAAFHQIPMVALWNPYNIPIEMDPGRPWTVTVEMDSEDWVRRKLRFKVRHPKWSAPNESRYSHIVPKDELWTPPFTFSADSEEGSGLRQDYEFQLRSATGGMDVTIPPGEVLMFAMHEHLEIPLNGSGRVLQQAELRAGLAPDGMYSFYHKENFQDRIFVDRKAYVGGSRVFDNRSNGVADINEHNYKTYDHAAGGYNEWHQTLTRRRSNRDSFWRTVDTLPYPFPMDPYELAQVSDSDGDGDIDLDDTSLLVKIPDPADLDISINRNGLNGWEILEVGMETGRPAQEGANWRNFRFQLYESGSADWPMIDVMHPNMAVPSAIHFARTDDSEDTSGADRIPPVWEPMGFPADDEPFTPATPGFPTYGMSFGLRLPDHSYEFNETTGTSAALSAPIRWLVDFNPLFPFPNRDPASRMQSAGGWRFNKRGFRSAPMYVGGFYMGDNRYADLSWATPNDRNMFMGHSDDTMPDYSLGEIPKAVIIELPESSNDLVSAASLAHAPLVSTHHILHPDDARALPGPSRGSRGNKEAVNYTIAYCSGHSGFAQPTFAIGNSESHFMVASDRAEQSFYPHPSVPTPTEPIPYLASRSPDSMSNGSPTYLAMYDYSWVYNEALWDDFFFTSDANTRLQWAPDYTSDDRDFTRSAERTLINGAFNINSTSVPAWATLLMSMMQVDPGSGGDDLELSAAFSRFLEPFSPPFETGFDAYDSKSAYLGYRRLTADDIWDDQGTPDALDDDTGLAVEIVRQIEERGPFLSMSDFVNRGLETAPVSGTDPEHWRQGALQRAIANAGLNEDMGDDSDPDSWVDASFYDPGRPDQFFEVYPENTDGPRNLGSSGTLMQSDLLSRIGSVLQPRSDTFKIRAKGILGSTDDPAAKAWCEVTVQRISDYVDPTNDSGELPQNLSPSNVAFGRQFKIISFRWLLEEEI